MTTMRALCRTVAAFALVAEMACGGETADGHHADPGSTSASTSMTTSVPNGSGSARSGSGSTGSVGHTATNCATWDCIPPCTLEFDATGCAVGCSCGSTSASSPPDAGPDCGAPPVTTYACSPVDADAGGCPVVDPDGGPTVYYPMGCISTLPMCSAFSSYQMPQTCGCTTSPLDGAPSFLCPL